ncbi:MAG TPA: PDZ domain-containing protein [Candidatus Acidoferrales bacterium]|nr:PDZ domain-containing protein [Candidatus Acidoferrales bacterium]
MKRWLRIVAVALLAAFEIACFVVAAVTWNQPQGFFGWNTATDGVTVANVEPNLPAARAGIRAGDRLVYSTLPVLGRINTVLTENTYAGATLAFQVERRGTVRRVTMTTQSLPPTYGAAQILYTFGGLTLGLVSLALLLLRPNALTWGFAFLAPPLVLPEALFLWAQRQESAVAYYVIGVLYGLQAAGIMLFAARFPANRPRGVSRIVDRLALPVGAATGAVYAYVTFAIYSLPAPPPRWILDAQDWALVGFATLCALAALSYTYATAARAERSRLAPVIATFVTFVVTSALLDFADVISSNVSVYIFWNVAFAISATLVAAAVAYGVVKHRIIDINFIVSRTLVFTILTAGVVAVFTLIEYLVGKLLEEGRLAQIIEVGAAVCIGVSLNFVHARLDRALDVVFFRRRHLAEERLAVAARTLPHATSVQLVDAMLVDEPADAFDLASAALFRRKGERYVRAAGKGWSDDCATALDRDDLLVVRLRAELAPLGIGHLRWGRSDVPHGEAQPVFAVPVASGHELEAVAIYGAHASGEDLDPDERRSISALAAGAALAYDSIARRSLRHDVELLEAENRTLREIESRLTGLIDRRLRPGDGETAP